MRNEHAGPKARSEEEKLRAESLEPNTHTHTKSEMRLFRLRPDARRALHL
ncbi:MAG: hypothetical protein RLZZ15_4302 [Verrucomicrobiota bacterium]|jgi:hypothetical protein